MQSAIVKRSIIIRDVKTSVSLEPLFWEAFKEMAHAAGKTVNDLGTEIDKARTHSNLSSAIRLAVFAHFDRRVKQEAA